METMEPMNIAPKKGADIKLPQLEEGADEIAQALKELDVK